MVAEQLREAGCKGVTILLEPVARNTAPAIAAAALEATAAGDDPLLLVLPSDHVIADAAAFRRAVAAAAVAAQQGQLVTFGIVSTGPETGYGYIKAAPGEAVRRVERFVEKPDAATAAAYVASGDYAWNSGCSCSARRSIWRSWSVATRTCLQRVARPWRTHAGMRISSGCPRRRLQRRRSPIFE